METSRKQFTPAMVLPVSVFLLKYVMTSDIEQ